MAEAKNAVPDDTELEAATRAPEPQQSIIQRAEIVKTDGFSEFTTEVRLTSAVDSQKSSPRRVVRAHDAAAGRIPKQNGLSSLLHYSSKLNKVGPSNEQPSSFERDDGPVFRPDSHAAGIDIRAESQLLARWTPETETKSSNSNTNNNNNSNNSKDSKSLIGDRLPPPSRFSDSLGDAIRFGDRLDLLKQGLWKCLVLLVYSAFITFFVLWCMTMVLRNIYGVDITGWSESSPGLVLQGTAVFDNGNLHFHSQQGVPVQIDSSHESNLRFQLAGRPAATKSILMGHQDGRDFIAASSFESTPEGNLVVSSQNRTHIHGDIVLGKDAAQSIVAKARLTTEGVLTTRGNVTVLGSLDLSQSNILVDQTKYSTAASAGGNKCYGVCDLMNKDAPVLQVANLLLKTIRYDILHLSIEDKADIAGVHATIGRGLTVENGATITDGGLVVTRRGLTVQSGGLAIDCDAFETCETKLNGGLRVTGGMTVTGGLTVLTGDVDLRSSSDIFMRTKNRVIDAGSASDNAGSITLSTGSSNCGSSGRLSFVTGDSEPGFGVGDIALSVGTSSDAEGGRVAIGAGKTTANSAAGGKVEIFAGRTEGASAVGGNVEIAAGSSVKSASGGVIIRTPNAGTPASGSAISGSILLSTGTSPGSVAGGISLSAGASLTSNGGSIVLNSGGSPSGGSSAAVGGNIILSTGSSAFGRSGGVYLGTGAGAASSGAVRIESGAATGGAGGSISIAVGSGTIGKGGDLALTAGTTTAPAGAGGDITLTSGGGATSGSVTIRSGSASGGASGGISLLSAAGAGAPAGGITLAVGTTNQPFGGAITITGGASTGVAAGVSAYDSVRIASGSVGGTQATIGSVSLYGDSSFNTAAKISVNKFTGIVIGTGPANAVNVNMHAANMTIKSTGTFRLTSTGAVSLSAPTLEIASTVTLADGANNLNVASHDGVNGLMLGGTLVTASAAELNVLAGSSATAADIAKLHNITASAAELNILDGVTATAADINKLVTLLSTTAELNYLSGVTLGQSAGSKAVTADVAGKVKINGDLEYTGAFVTPSDRRLKANITPLADAVDTIRKLNGVSYTWDHSVESAASYDHELHLGLIAQDVQAALPHLVKPILDGGYLGVDYIGVVPVLVEAVKELSEQKRRFEASHYASLKAADSRYRELEMHSQAQRASLAALERHVRGMGQLVMAAAAVGALAGLGCVLYFLHARPDSGSSSCLTRDVSEVKRGEGVEMGPAAK